VTRSERIEFLLLHYQDVLAGLRDGGGDGDRLPLMCRAWNAPGYQELERLLPLLAGEAPRLHRAVVALYVHPQHRRRAVCSKCGQVVAPAAIGELHRHGRKGAPFVARMLREPLFPVDAADVPLAVAWLERHWRGDVFVPDELLPLVSVA